MEVAADATFTKGIQLICSAVACRRAAEEEDRQHREMLERFAEHQGSRAIELILGTGEDGRFRQAASPAHLLKAGWTGNSS